MTDWNKVGALAAIGCFMLAGCALLFQIKPLPWTWAGKGTVEPLRGSRMLTGFLILGFVISGVTIWRTERASTPVSHEIGGWVIAVLVVASFVLAGLATYGAWRQPKSKLVIHSAVYGTGPANDADVRAKLVKAPADALIAPITNEFLGCDPAPRKVKRLRVTYSYQTPDKHTIDRPEDGYLFLPPDPQAQKLENELELLKNQPKQPPVDQGQIDIFLESDPRIYLCRISTEGDNFLPATPFVIENRGGGVAHNIHIQPIILGYSQIDFEKLDNLSVAHHLEACPIVKGADMGKHSVLEVMTKAWNEKCTAAQNLDDLPFPVVITYTNFRGDRHLETTAEMSFSYLKLSYAQNHLSKGADDVFVLHKTSFRYIHGSSTRPS